LAFGVPRAGELLATLGATQGPLAADCPMPTPIP
jgi:hypothetical protein